MAKVKVTDKNEVPGLLKEIKKLQNSVIEVGVLGDNDSHLLMVANVNEFGVDINVTEKMRAYLHTQGLHLKESTEKIRIPERSYIRKTFDTKYNKIVKEVEKGIQAVIAGRVSADRFLNLIGGVMADMVKETLVELRTPPNHPFTIKQKSTSAGKGDNPLIGKTSRLFDSISYRIRT